MRYSQFRFSLAIMKQQEPDNRLNNERHDQDAFHGSVHAPTFDGNEAGHGGFVTRDSNREQLDAGHH